MRKRGGVVTNGCAVLVLGSLGIAVLAGFWFSVNPPAHTPASPGQPSTAPTPAKIDPAAAKRFEACKAKLKKTSGDMLNDLSWKGGGLPPRVVVGPTFFAVDFKTKQGFADTVNCFLMAGDESRFINFDLLDWKDEKVVATYYAGHLKME